MGRTGQDVSQQAREGGRGRDRRESRQKSSPFSTHTPHVKQAHTNEEGRTTGKEKERQPERNQPTQAKAKAKQERREGRSEEAS